MGGTIGVYSETGQGSTFWVELPISGESASPARTSSKKQQPPVHAGRTVLYIEDNLSNLRLIERLLSRRPVVRLVPAMQGHIGLDLARDHEPDLVLLDLQLPDVSGHEVFRHLRENPRTSEIPVVIMSADASPRTIEELLSAGARDFLPKPVDVKRFLEIIDQIIRAETVVDALPIPIGT